MSLTTSDIDRITRLVEEDQRCLRRDRAAWTRKWPRDLRTTDGFINTHGAYTERIVHDDHILVKLQLMREAWLATQAP